jgi:hypothetical protein
MTVGYEVIDVLKDLRVNCYSLMTSMSIKDYLSYIEETYKNKGGLKGQRIVLKTNTAVRIRNRMIEDLKQGAVLPPIVIGIIIDDQVMKQLDSNPEDFKNILMTIPTDHITIIDGMQRTTALLETYENISPLPDRKLRVEYWIATSINSLVYRMLVLNTGQIPWSLKRQLEVIFSQLISDLHVKIPDIELITSDDPARRKAAGQYQANQFIELYLLFGTRKENLNIQERLAEEFARLDFIQASSNPHFTEYFFEVAKIMVLFDKTFSKFEQNEETKHLTRFKGGKDIFSSHPARVGFVVAFAQAIMGRPGIERKEEDQMKIISNLIENASLCLGRLNEMNVSHLSSFLDLATLDEIVSDRKSGKVGEFEREFFLKAFQTLVEENFILESMAPCWRAHI